MGIDKTQLDKIIAQNKSEINTDTEVKSSLDTSKLDNIINKYKAAETPEDKERVETMMSIGKLNRALMGGQLHQIGADIPDFTNKWTYDYLMSDEQLSDEDVEAQMYQSPLSADEELIPKSVVVGDAEYKSQKPLRGSNLKEEIKDAYDTEHADFLASKRAVSSHIVDKYEVDKDGYVTIGEQRMPRAQAEMIMQDIVEQTMHPTMMQKNKAYRDNWFIGNTGMNAEDYLRNLDANLASLQQELNTEVGKDIDAIRSTTTALQMAENAGIDPAIAQAIVTNERYGGKAIRDMRDQIQSILNNDFGSGLKEGFDALSMISAGLNDLVANVELGNVLNKVYNDKPLTEREKIAYEAYMIGDQINELEDLFGGRSWWNEVGQGVGASGEMAVGFAAGMGAVGKLGKFANLPIRATLKSVRRAAKNDVWDAIKMAGIRGAQLAGRSLKNVAMAEGAGLIAAPMLPSTYASLAEKRNGQYAVENGKLIFKPTKAWKDVIDTWIESGTEIGSELIGARIGELVGGSARAFGRMLSLDKLAGKAGIGKHSNILFGWEKPAAFKAFERSVGFQGAVAEPLSEIWGDATANMLKGIITGNGEFAQFRDVDYWTKTLATCAIYGGSLQVASAPHAVARYANIARYGRERKRALSRIKIAKLHDDVSAALAIDNIDDAAKAFAQIDWGSYSLDQRAYAMDAIRADYAQRVAIANQVEDGRMTQFLHVADRIEDMEYRGMDGLTPKGFIKTIVDKDGVTYTAIQGGKDKPFYICLDAEGNKVSIPTANIEGERNVALGDVISQQYDSMYSVESEQERQRNIVDRYNDMRKGESSAESIKRIMSLFGVKQYRSGDDVTLVNGETATVEEFIPETGEFIVSLHNGGMETLPFYNVLSESTLTADAQKLNNASTVNANVEQQIDAEERSAEAANEPRTTRFVEGDIVVTPTGANARVREVNEDGTYEVDYNTEEEANPSNMILENYAEADLRFENEGVEVASTEVVPQEIEVAEIEQTAPESNADATMPEAKPIQQNEDGTINYDAIDDVEQFATLYEREVGGRENATQDVADMRDSAQEDLLKSIEKGKKIRNANEKVANRREQQALAERVAFYNNVLDILAPAEQATSAEEAAPDEQTTNEVQTVPSQSAEAEGKQTGLIANEYSEQLIADFAESLDAVAKAFGLRVMFVPLAGGGKANAEINGNEVRIAWKYRGKAIHFLIGHEFTHRMQDLSPEEYNAFKGAVIKYLGEEEWNARIADIKEAYDKQAVAYTDTLIEDEGIADFVGELIEDADSFDLFIAQNAKEGWFKRFIEALKALFSKLSKTDVKTELYNDVLDKLGAMGSKATEVATEYEAETMRESVMQGQTKFSLSEESIKIFDAAKAKFGTTYDMREAGYILPDGSMLDFSGRHQVEGDASFLNGDRTVDHREISDIAYDADDNETGISTDLGDFLDRGAIRIDSSAGAINLNVAPTKAQKDRLKRLIERNDGYVYIDFGKGWDTEHYAEYEAARASRVLGDIDRYFDEGIKPTGNVRFSLIGEVGAEALDRAEEATIRLDNLNIARQMEKRGDSALDIRMATGWERGADGLWRYEIMDADVNLYDGDENIIRKKIEVAEEEEKDFMYQSKADTKELRERTNTYLAEMREKYGAAEGEETDAMSEEEIANLQSLTNKEIEFEDYKERRRNELYNRRMALEAQLAYVSVKNSEAPAEIATTRLGYILQGNDAEVLFAAHPSLRDIEVQFVTDIRDGAFAAYATKGGYKRIELNAKKTPVDMLAPYILHEVQHAIQDIEGFAGGGNLSSLQSDENVTAKEAYDYYHKIAGEVEARNVSARINMTPEERRATLLSETEDVAREDQIFLREGAEMAMAKGVRLPKEEYAKLSSTIMERQHIYGRPSFDYATTFDNFYVYDYLGDGNSFINFAIPIVGNEEFIQELSKIIEDGTIDSAASLDLFLKEILVGERSYHRNIVNAIKKRRGNKGFLVPRSRRQNNSTRGISTLSKRSGGSAATRGESGNSNESGNQELTTLHSLITPEMDAAYLDAVERGDMATAQKMVMEAAKLAMPNTKVVDEDGNPKVVYHGDRKKARYIFSTDTFFTPYAEYAKRYTNSTGEVYATYLDIKKPFDIRDKRAYGIFTEFRGGRTPVTTTTGAMDWGEYSYEDLQEYVEDVAPNEYDGFILDEGADPDGNGGVVHRGLSFVPFTPNQIKSADPVTYDDAGNIIPLSERFNPEKEDIRFSLIGEIGAANLEEYGRYSSPMLALEIARELEADGKSALEIRVATNWERGKDGKWRYEITDGEYIHPSDDDITSKEYRLKDILNNPDLYKAYPNLADAKVKYDPNMKGSGMFKGDTIKLNSNTDEAEIFSTLIHEVQHAIQLKEMFAVGGNVAEQTSPFKADIAALEEETKALAQEFKRTSNIHLLRKGYLLYQGLRRAFKHQMLTDKGYESYRTLAGEVEARNAQKRHNMSEEERLNTLLTATEDVARDSQRVIFHEANVGKTSSPRLSVRGADMVDAKATEEEYKEAMLIKAQELERTLDGEKLDIVQEIADQTGWVRVDNDEWEYYGIGEVALTSTAKEKQAVLRWMQAKRAVRKARVRNMYWTLITEAYEGGDAALVSKYETERAEAIARINAEYADKIEAFEEDATPFIKEYYDSERWSESKNIVNDELRKMRKKMEAIADKERTRRIDALGKREAVAAIKTQINNLIRGDLSRYMRKRDIQAIMKAVNDSQSAYAMLQSVDNAMRTIYQLRIRKEMERMNNLTKMRIVLNETNIDPYLFLKGVIGESAARKLAENYWRGVNSNGVNVEKGVDADTAAVMQFIHDNIDYKKVKGGSEIFNVSEYISSLEAKINEDVTLDAEMKTKKIEALPMIADYLEIQQMMDDFEVNYNRTRKRSSNIAELTKKITTLNNEIKALESTPDKVIASDNQLKDRQKALLKARKELRSEYRAVLAERIQNDDMYFGAMPQIVERLYQANKAIEDTLRKGRLELSLHKSREEAHKKEIINDALKDMDGYAPTTDKPVMQRVAKVALGVATKQFHSLDYLTREMAKYSTNGEGRIWRRFAPTTLAASNNIQANMRDIAKQMDDKAESLFDMSYVKMRRLAERTQIGTYPVRKFIQDGVDERGYMKGKETVVEMPLYVCQALDILATWGQENGRQSLEKMGFDEGVIDRITRALDENNPQWREYSSWVINSLLPSRRPKLNEAHKKVFGAPMAAERNYFPIRRDKDLLHKDEDIANDGLLPLPSVVTGSVIARTNSTANIDLNMSFFDVLEENLTETEAWSEMAPIIKDLNILLSSTPVKLAMKNIREDFVLEFRKAAKVATLNYTSEYGEFDKWVVPMINKAWATNKLALKGYTALKQLAGTLLFLPYAYDPRFRIILASRYLLGDRLPILMIVGDAEENMKKLLEIRVDKLPIIGNVMWAMEHSVNYRNRVLSATAGNETFAKKIAEAKWHDKNWATDVRNILDKVMNYSMLMIAGVDAFTVAGGMRAIYDYETLILNTPKEKAMLKAEFYANKTQQSAEPLFLSPMQQSRSFFAQSLSTFQNAPIAQGRIVAESLMNLIRNSSKTAMNTVNMKIEDMVAAQLQEEDAGNVMSTQQRGERAREIEKQIRETEFEKLLKDALSEVKASKKTSISPLLWNAYLAPLAFNLTSILPYLIFGDDEDRKKDLVKDVFAWSWAGPFASIPVLSHLIQAAQGYDFSLSGAYDNFTEDVQNIIDHIGDKGIDWGLAGIVLDNLSRRFLGIDYQTVLNVAQGIDSMIEDGYSHEALMKLINAPDSQIRLLAGERREDETAKEYIERILRLYSIGEYSKYESYFNEKGQYIGPDNNPLKIRAYRAKRLHSEYNEAYTRNVVRRFGERGELSAMAENDAEYTERAKSLNWSAEATPSHTQNIIRGEYRAPLEDLAVEGYAELAVIQEQIAHLSKNIKRFAGTDEQYYEMVEALDSLKVNFKIKYDELIK